MAPDDIGKRFEKRQKDKKLHDLADRARPKEELEAEEELIKKTPKVDPIKADKEPGRNDPCPCGSGLKYKKCHGAK